MPLSLSYHLYLQYKDKKEGDSMFTAIVFGIILTGTIGFIIAAEVAE
ncbi:hypothetical protein [Virgibacillus sp. L01]